MDARVRRSTWPGSEVFSANQRLKRSFSPVVGGSIAAAALFHFLVFVLWPQMAVDDYRSHSRALAALEIPPEVEIPPPPPMIATPQVPVLSFRLDISDEITIQEVTFTTNWIERLPPPPVPKAIDLSEQPVFTPRTVEPRLERRQRNAVQRYLERNYPASLLAAGIGARAVLWIFIDVEGAVQETQVVQSSGYPAFDQVAEDALRSAKFSPAWNRDSRVPVWVQLPIIWQVRR